MTSAPSPWITIHRPKTYPVKTSKQIYLKELQHVSQVLNKTLQTNLPRILFHLATNLPSHTHDGAQCATHTQIVFAPEFPQKVGNLLTPLKSQNLQIQTICNARIPLSELYKIQNRSGITRLCLEFHTHIICILLYLFSHKKKQLECYFKKERSQRDIRGLTNRNKCLLDTLSYSKRYSFPADSSTIFLSLQKVERNIA